MDDLAFDILRAAVRVARDEQIRRLSGLRSRLAQLYPEAPDQCEAAIKAWAQYTQNTYRHAPPPRA